ncbi:MAG: hypothetical protein J1F23_07835 [Oscillospiraceae bacterium]|nr:hypothetical protein [Oscillospiraceae bacterium]
MPKCPVDYKWVRVPRNLIPTNCKGIMKDYFKIAFASAYKDGIMHYCGYENEVEAKQWIGGLAGLKRLLERRNRNAAINTIFLLEDLGYVAMFVENTGKMTITVPDIILPQTCSIRKQKMGEIEKYIAEHRNELDAYDIDYLNRRVIDFQEKCYVSDGSGYICIPRNLTERLVEKHYVFDDADAFYDLYLHTVDRHEKNPFSELCPTVMYEKGTSVFTFDYLCTRWGWNKSKVSRFFKKFNDYFSLVKLQSSYGCVIFNKVFQTDFEFSVPTQEDCFTIVNKMKARGKCFGAYEELMYYAEENYSENDYINCIINGFMFLDPEADAWKAKQDLAKYSVSQTDEADASDSKNENSNSENESSTPSIGNCFFDRKKCVLQFSPYNNTLVDIYNHFLFYISARNIYLTYLESNSNTLRSKYSLRDNFTLNCKKSICPMLRTGFQCARVSYYRIRSPITVMVTQSLNDFLPFDDSKANYPFTGEASTASPPQEKSSSTVKNSPTKALKNLLHKALMKFKFKINYLTKGVKL